MYKTIIKLFLLILIFSFCQNSEKEIFHYHEDDKKASIEEITFNLSILSKEEIPANNSIFIKIENNNTKIIEWDFDKLKKDAENSVINITDKNGIKRRETVEIFEGIGGSASNHLSGQIKLHTTNKDDIYLEFPLSKELTTDKILRLFNLPIILSHSVLISTLCIGLVNIKIGKKFFSKFRNP